MIDGELIAHWEESLCALPEIREAAVVVRETADTLPPLHFDDLLPGWKSIAAGSAGTADAAPADETTAGGAATAPGAPGVPAIAHGRPALALPTGAPVTLPEALERAAREHPENGITYLRSDGSAACQTYPELLEASQRLLAGLRELGLKPQDKLLFQLPDLADFVVAFWAAMLGGFVPVPLSIPPTYEQANSALDKLANAWRMLDRPWILCGRETLPAVHSLSDLLDLDGLRVAAVDDLQRAAPDREPHPCRPDDLALLLLTSGSTGMPKAVTQTHRALLIRSAATARHNGFTPEDVSLNWMPLDHVGGIVMFNLRDVYVGCRQVHAPTAAVLAGPLLWLDWMERFRATATWAPNFAFGLVNDRAGEIARRRWDLSSMRFILNAGEAIVAKTARTFLSLLAPHGLPATAMKPAWGMSETCSAITFSHDFTLDSTHDADSFVEVGVPIPEAAVRIVDADHHVVPEGTIGHLQVQGPMITTGYYRRPELNGEVFAPGGWFDTGDLGVLRNGQLSITGRAKDVIIVRGVNYYSHEIEAVIEEIPDVEVSFTAACPVRPPGSDTDELAIFFHTPSEDWERRIELIREIRNRVAEKSGVNPTYVIPMAREEIPKTAIGKIQRPHLRQQLEAGQLQDVLKRIDLLTGSARTLPAWFYERVWRPREPSARPAARPAGRWLIFLDPHGLGADLCRRLERQGHTCITVEIAGEYRQIDARRFVLDPGQAEHYRRLLQSLASPEDPVERVVHLWTSGERADKIDSLEALERAQGRGVYSVLFLVQALVEAQGEERAVELAVVSSRAQLTGPSDRLAAAGACLPGLLKTIPLELPAIHCRHIDLELGRAEADGWRLLGELDLPTAEAEVAYRDGRRLVPVLTRADIGQKERGGPAITPGGLYLVTGGLGGIGSRLAQLLHRSFGARLLLVGRTALPEPAAWARCLADGQTVLARRISAHMALARAGAEFLYRAVDVVDGAGLEQAVAEAEATWQRPLDGIFHLAGILDESDLEDHWTVSERHRVAAETRETLARMLAPKVQGTWTLGRLLVERPTALFVAFSSVNSLFGGSTFSAYAAANSFVDAWTLDRRYRGRPAQCFNWTMWDDLGMSRGNPAFARDAARAAGYHVLSPERGFFSLLAGLEYGAAQLVVGLDGDNRHLRHRILTAACERQELAAFFTGPAEAGRLQELSVKDRFGTPSASRFRRLAEMPRTTAGDVDRERLIVLVEKERKTGPAERAAPQNEIERQLAEIWQQVLGTPSPVGTHDNFFHLGGDSILSIQVLARAAEKGLRLTPKQIFQHPTIAELAAVVELTGPRAAEQELVTGEVPLTPIQRWFFEQDLPEPHHFNMALLLTALQPLDGELLERAFAHLALHHDALRMRYRRLGDGWQQVNAGTEERRWASVVTLADEPPAEQQRAITTHAGRLQASLSLTDGPLLRVTYFDLGPGEPGRLLIVVHHLVIDGVAWRILLHDLQVAYGQLRAGNEVRLAPKTTSFQHWSMRLNEIGRSADWTAEESYWLAEPRPRISSLPVDSGDGENTEGSAHRSTVHLDAEETRALLQEVPKAYRTQINDVLLTALAQVLTAWTSARAVLVDLEGHGREELFDDVDLSRTVGWFTTLFPMLLELAPDTPPGAALKSVKEQLRAVPQRGIGYGLLRYRGDEVAAALARLPPAEVSFNYLGQIDQVLAQSETFAAGREPIGDFSSPAGKRRHRLDVVAHVMEGCLEVGWIYSRNVHRDATVERLAQDFIAALRTLIDHCLTSATGGATPSDFPLARLDQGQVDRLIGGERDVADVYPLSSTQQGMLFHALYSPESAMYFDQASWKLKGALDVASLAEAWRMVIDRHAILRTGFVWLDLDRPLQVVRQRVDLPLRLEDWRQMPADESRLAALLAHDRELGFDLGQAPLMRLKLVRLEADHYHLVWTRHHILLDGWTQAIVLKEVFACYEARRHSRPPELGRPIPYRDYVAWLERQNLEEAESYWRRTLAGFTTATRLMELGQRESAALPGEECDAELHRLSPDLTARLQMQAQRHRLTLNTLVQGAWGRLLCCYSGEEDVVFGSTFAGRPADLPGVESMVGLFINTLPVRMTVPDQEPLLVWLQRLQEQQIERRQYEHTPLTQVQRWSEIPPGQLLFESLYVFENFPVDASLGKGVGGLEVEAVETAVRTNYPLTLVAVPGDELALRTYFDATRVDGQKVRRLLGHLSTFLAGVTEGLERRIADVPLLSVEERRQLVTEWNALAPEHDSATPMARKVEAQVAQHGDKAAVILGTGPGRRQLTYRELDQRSNRLARFLRRRSVGPDTLVGVSLPPSPDRVVALLVFSRRGAHSSRSLQAGVAPPSEPWRSRPSY
ncbi:MAG TPA: SDR family NAD(P)-dependent oxidoreductase [Thermoanaerobaculia bacterium]|nr:SDR family NAD(P)-dependent oxidoreductase [Thermoanaerobaculia bacterium]